MLELALQLETAWLHGGAAPDAYADYLIGDDFSGSKYRQSDDNTGATGSTYSSPASLAGYSYTGVGDPTIDSSGYSVLSDVTLSHNAFADAAALTDQDMLIWAKGTPSTVGASQRLAMLWLDSSNNIDFSLDGAARPKIGIVAGGSAVVNAPGTAITAGTEVTIFARRASGNWRVGRYVGSTLTWHAAEAAGAFPTGINKVIAGNYGTGTSPWNGDVAKIYTKAGAFPNDADVIAAFTEAP